MTLPTITSEIGARYQTSFSALQEKNEKAFIPFVIIGDPNAEQSLAVIKALIDGGADAQNGFVRLQRD